MQDQNRRRWQLMILFALFVLVVAARGGSAEETTCYDRYGVERECTFVEEAAECFGAADDSYQECAEDRRWWQMLPCVIELDFNFVACGVDSVKDLIL